MLLPMTPLAANKAFCHAPDGTRLWNPKWNQPSTASLNNDYLKAVVDLVIDQDKACFFIWFKATPTVSDNLITAISHPNAWFYTLSRSYQNCMAVLLYIAKQIQGSNNKGQECSNIKNLKTKLCARKKKVSFQHQF
jgi:hypothetical protein